MYRTDDKMLAYSKGLNVKEKEDYSPEGAGEEDFDIKSELEMMPPPPPPPQLLQTGEWPSSPLSQCDSSVMSRENNSLVASTRSRRNELSVSGDRQKYNPDTYLSRGSVISSRTFVVLENDARLGH